MSNRPMEAVFRPALILMSGRGLGFIAAFAIPMVLARAFDQDTFGTYKQLFLIFGTLVIIAQLGMAESLYYFLPVQPRKGGGFIFNTLLVLGGIGLACFVLLWLLQDFIAELMNNPGLVGNIPYIGIYLVFMLMSVVLEITMTVKKQHFAASCTYAVSDLARALLYITPVLLFDSLEWLMIGAVAFAVLRFATTLVYAFREFGTELRPSAPLLRKHTAYALPFSLAVLIEVTQVNFHMYAVSYYFDVATFAIYAVGCLQVPLMDFLSTSTSNVMMINMREKVRQNDTKAAFDIWFDALRKLALIFCPLVLGMLIIANELIVILFTSTYSSSIPIFMVFTCGSLFTVLLTDGVLRVFAMNRFLIFQNLVQLTIIATLIQFFLNRFDLIGAVLVTLFATSITKTMALIRIKYLMGVSLRALLPWKSLASTVLISFLAAVPALLIKSALDLPDIPTLMITGFVFTVSYYCLLLWMGPMREDEKQMLVKWAYAPLNWLGRERTIKKPGEVPR